MSGGFDFPPASDSSTAIGSLTRRFDNLRQTFQTEREAARDSLRGAGVTPLMPRPRRRVLSATSTGAAPAPRNRSPPYTGPPLTPASERIRSGSSGTRQQLWRLRQEMTNENRDVADALRERRAQLDRVTSHLNEAESRLRNIDPAVSLSSARCRASKRRKIDHDNANTVPQPYGYYGQVAPGQLRLEIVSCDAGQHRPIDASSFNLDSYRAENVLRNDNSVYCTRSSRCDMILRQQGEALFHLESLVIAAPKRNFPAPAQEGLVFVGMSASRLSAATSHYSIQTGGEASYATRTHTPTPPPAQDNERLSLLEAVNDDQIWQASRSRYHVPDPDLLPTPPRIHPSRRHIATIHDDDLFAIGDVSDASSASASMRGPAFLDNCDWPPTAHDTTAQSGLARAPTPPPFTVPHDMDSSDEDASARREREHSYGPYGLPPLVPVDLSAESDSSASTTPEPASMQRPFARRTRRRSTRTARQTSLSGVGNKVLDTDTNEGVLQPNAEFCIPQNDLDCEITVRFNPPVAGRFILLKLFSPHLMNGASIEIERISAHGFSGPRFFPSVEMK